METWSQKQMQYNQPLDINHYRSATEVADSALRVSVKEGFPMQYDNVIQFPTRRLCLRKNLRPNSTSRYRGVYFRHKAWYANCDGHYLGKFSSEIKAAEAVAEYLTRLLFPLAISHSYAFVHRLISLA
jgi:hypothetical protein